MKNYTCILCKKESFQKKEPRDIFVCEECFKEHKATRVSELPKCDFCQKEATVDGKTVHGAWGFMCHSCFILHGTGLGLGVGQRLVLE